MRSRTRVSLAGSVVLGGLLLAGCGGDDGGSSSNNTTADVVVRGDDALRFDKASYTARTGSVTIQLIDDGGQPHTLLIEGNTAFKKLAVNSKGDKDSGSADLQPGTYTIYCDVVGHRAAGMEAKLVVN